MRRIGGLRAALCGAFVLAASGLSASPVTAQTSPPNYDNRDEHGVDRVTGRFSMDMVEGGIGGDSGVTMVRYYGTGIQDNWTGLLLRTASGSTQYATLTFGKISERFTKSGSSWIADKANGATLTENIADKKFTYRAPDGTTIVYDSPADMASAPFGSTITVPLCTGSGADICAVPTRIARPNGLVFTLTWQAVEGCVYPGGGPGEGGPGDDPVECTIYVRLSDVRNSSSFGMKIKHQSNQGPSSLTGAPPPIQWWRRASLKFLDLSQVYCDPAANDCDGVAGNWPTVAYSNPSALGVWSQHVMVGFDDKDIGL